MGQGFRAVFPIVVIGIVADLLVELLLGLKVMGFEVSRFGGGFRVNSHGVRLGGGLGGHRSSGEEIHSEATGEDLVVAATPITDPRVQPLSFPFGKVLVTACTRAGPIEEIGIAPQA